ncbi:LysR family transcriptional regulator [Porticoccus sp. GXU_MW_L64]
MNIRNVDLNLLIYLSALLEERNVSRAAERLAITQPAMSNALKRLRELFADPLLVRTSEGMTPTDKARALEPELAAVLASVEAMVQTEEDFDPAATEVTFRIQCSDYIEFTLLLPFIAQVQQQAPGIDFDILSPGDASLQAIEKGIVDLAINRFSRLPQAFHQATVWRDNFCCLVHKDHPYAAQQTLEQYLSAEHMWVNKTGLGAAQGVSRKADVHKLGWVDEALAALDESRNIRVFSRHYMVASHLERLPHLIATLPRRMAMVQAQNPDLRIVKVPFQVVPIEVKMAWSPLLQHSAPHKWLRRSLLETAKTVSDR